MTERVEIVPFGPCARALVAEYDAQRRVIRINADALARLDGDRETFIAAAVAHERAHANGGDEAAAHATACAAVGAATVAAIDEALR